MYVVELDIRRMWITLPEDPGGVSIVCGSTQQSPATAQLDGDLRHYAGRRTQAVVRDQDDIVLTYTLRHLSLVDRDTLLAWRGRTVLLRTMDAERQYCAYAGIGYRRLIGTSPEDGSGNPFTFDIDVSFFRVSYNEAV